jgi:type II secretory ATPase GspE/PulE/Tfp pilus assembly ATPase PilB-like protein
VSLAPYQYSAVPHWQIFDQVPAFSGLIHPRSGSRSKLKSGRLLALELEGKKVILLSEPDLLSTPDWYHFLEQLTSQGYGLEQFATATSQIIDLLEYEIDPASREKVRNETEFIAEMLNESVPISNFQNLIKEVIKTGASDVHLEIQLLVATIRLRIFGVMRKFRSYPSAMIIDSISAGYTVMAEELSRTDAAFNSRLPQAAMIPMEIEGRKYVLRYQSHPSVGGLDVVMRVLRLGSGENRNRSLSDLGYLPFQVNLMSMASASAWGGVFIAGITGSGKTTTLNTILNSLARTGDKKIISIEDPVEYLVDGVSHLSIQRANSDSGNGSANPFLESIRAFLRLDPDIGMFGEIRDNMSGEVAQAAIETGHKIFTTVHATSALGIVPRLTSKMVGLSRATVCNPEFLSALVYQVLMPRSCVHCKRPAAQAMTVEQLEPYRSIFGLNPDTFFAASDEGCANCRIPGMDHTNGVRLGTKGMQVAAEVVIPDTHLLQLLQEGRDIAALQYRRSLRKTDFDDADMTGKEAWGHALYEVSAGNVDPYFFESTFGSPHSFKNMTASNPVRESEKPL